MSYKKTIKDLQDEVKSLQNLLSKALNEIVRLNNLK